MTIRPARQHSQCPRLRQGRSSVALLALVLAITGGIGATIYFSRTPTPSSGESTARSPSADELDAAEAAARSRADQSAVPRTSVSVRHAASGEHSNARATAPSDGLTVAESHQASVEAQEAIARLSQLDFSSKALTPEQSASVKTDFKQLLEQGTNSVPAIRQFLQQNKDLSLDEIKSGSPVGYASLRTGMFDTLKQIGGPEAESALAEVLRSTGDPAEIGQLARQLEELAPGQHREEVLNAARETLTQAAESKTKADVGPLFQVLQTYGGASEVSDLQKAIPQYQYYGLMALAGLPEGQGISALVNEARPSGPADGAKATFALQMLAQAAPQYPEAKDALIAQAKSGQVPDRAWRRIAEALGGDQYQFTRDAGVTPNEASRIVGAKSYHIGATDENFYSLPVSASASEEDVVQRRALIDQLLNVANSSAATEALQRAKNQLVVRAH